MVIVMMGPAGAGKSTVGTALAQRLEWAFVDADEHHPPANIAKMERGLPLDDSDRVGWLATLHAIVARAIDRREPLVLACSALTARHRELIADDLRSVRFVYLKTSPVVLRARLADRRGHFAKADLLDSQLAVFEEPGADALTLDGAADIDTIVGHIRLEFGV
jgi:gluconokinase